MKYNYVYRPCDSGWSPDAVRAANCGCNMGRPWGRLVRQHCPWQRHLHEPVSEGTGSARISIAEGRSRSKFIWPWRQGAKPGAHSQNEQQLMIDFHSKHFPFLHIMQLDYHYISIHNIICSYSTYTALIFIEFLSLQLGVQVQVQFIAKDSSWRFLSIVANTA